MHNYSLKKDTQVKTWTVINDYVVAILSDYTLGIYYASKVLEVSFSIKLPANAVILENIRDNSSVYITEDSAKSIYKINLHRDSFDCSFQGLLDPLHLLPTADKVIYND